MTHRLAGDFDLGPAPDADEIERVEQLANPVPRNLQITLGYGRLSRAMGRLVGAENANWCTFATWASKRAGRSIRGEDLPKLRERIRDRLERDDEYHVALSHLGARLRGRRGMIVLDKERITERVLDLVNTVSAFVAEGNLSVFAELAPAFSEIIVLFEGDRQLDREKLDRFVSRFRPGATSDGGQGLLRAAFTHYVEAMFESDPKAKAELMLLANDQVGLHEQTRLQPHIAGALNAPIQILGDWIVEDIRAKLPFRKRRREDLRPDELHGHYLSAVRRIWREEATRYLMELALPGEVLGLGWDVPLRPGQPMFPTVLEDLGNQELLTLLREHDRSWNTTVGSGAVDWSSLGDRMNYIVDLFRARQQELTLHQPPFTAEQCQAIRAGSVPPGQL